MNEVHDEIKRNINLGVAIYYLDQKTVLSCLLSELLKY